MRMASSLAGASKEATAGPDKRKACAVQAGIQTNKLKPCCHKLCYSCSIHMISFSYDTVKPSNKFLKIVLEDPMIHMYGTKGGSEDLGM